MMERIGPSALATTLKDHRERVRGLLREAAESLAPLGLPRPALDGKILRPLAAYLAVPEPRRHELDRPFWLGALAVELVHEASLLHDDILDDAPERRGRPTLSASAGVGPALVLGDHLLTSAYRAAARAESPAFLQLFITSVERTVAGEIAQERSQGRALSAEEYREIVTGKSGELFRSVLALPAALLGIGHPERVGELGARLGCLYQMVDDFLDYCPAADRGKLPLQDYHQRKWTWPLGLAEIRDFDTPEAEVLERLFTPGAPGEPPPMRAGIREVEERVGSLLAGLEGEGMETELLGLLLGGWVRQLAEAADREILLRGIEAAQSPGPIGDSRREVPRLPGSDEARRELAAATAPLEDAGDWLAYFSRHARSFRFAARLFPREALHRVAGVYAFCRFTDDLVDEAGDQPPAVLERRLDAWLRLAGDAHEGRETGIPLLDDVVGVAGREGVPFHYLHELVEGVRMDITPREYASVRDLRVYSYRVASAVGGWLTELFGVRDPRALERAFALGHAMQLTNILRDVGEDLEAGRLYLPQDLMERHGVDRDLLGAMKSARGAILPGYRNLLEELMAQADADYERAFRALPALPPFFRRPVAVAARVYQGIHDEIRRNGYDNLSRRARTSLPAKIRLGSGGLLNLLFLPREPFPGVEGRRAGVRSGPSAAEEQEATA